MLLLCVLFGWLVSLCGRGVALKNPVCPFKTPPCVRFECTHGGVLDGHTGRGMEREEGGREGVVASSAHQNLPTEGCRVLQVFTKETLGSYPFKV